MKTKNNLAQWIVPLALCALSLAACSSDSSPKTMVQFSNGISAGFEDGLCIVHNAKSPEDVAPTVMVVLNPERAPPVEDYQIKPGDALVIHPNHPPQIPEFPIFIVSPKNKIAHVIGNADAVPKDIANDSI